MPTKNPIDSSATLAQDAPHKDSKAAKSTDSLAHPKSPKGPKSAPPAGVSGGQQAPVELSRARFVAVFGALMMSVFLFALYVPLLRRGRETKTDVDASLRSDQLILATAIPKITAQFNSLTQVSGPALRSVVSRGLSVTAVVAMDRQRILREFISLQA